MTNQIVSNSRRDFMKFAGAFALVVTSGSCSKIPSRKRLNIGHTGITWPGGDSVEQAIADIAGLGYHGFETFGNTLEWWENERGGI